MATLKRTMFREYDIRGKESTDELNEESIYTIARGFGKMLRDAGITDCIVGHDARTTSESFHAQAQKALTESGVNCIDIGTVTTPMSYFAQYHFNVKGLCMITASHNPAGWNGLKLGVDLSSTLGPADLGHLYTLIEEEDFAGGEGTVRKGDVKDAYINDLVSRAKLAKPLKVLVNTGNGTAGLFAPEFFRKAGCEVVEHFTNVDPSYPNYTANPDGEKMMQDTGAQVVKNACDIGFAIDGDGDRLGVVDEKGQIVWPDRYIILLSRLVLAKHQGAKIVFDVKVSEALPEDITAHGGIPIAWKTGHSYIKAKLRRKRRARRRDEQPHFWRRLLWLRRRIFAGLKLLEYLASQKETLSELVATTPYYVSTPTIQVKTTDEEKYTIVNELVEHSSAKATASSISAARVSIWMVAASSERRHTPTLVLRFEAKNEEILESIKNHFKEKLAAFPNVSTNWDSSGH